MKKIALLLLVGLLVACSGPSKNYFEGYHGDYQDNHYLNEKLGFAFKNNDEYQLSSHESIKADKEALYEDKSKDQIKELDKVIKLMNARYLYHDVSMRVDLEYRKNDPRLDVDTYFDYLKNFYKNSDLDLKFLDPYPYQIADLDFTLLTGISNEHERIVYFFVRVVDDYILSITISALNDERGNDQVLELLRLFEPYTVLMGVNLTP